MAAASIIVPLLTAAPALIDSGVKVAQIVKDKRASKSGGQPARARTGQATPSAPVKRRTSGRASGTPSLDAEQRANVAAIAAEVASYPLPPALASSRDGLTLALVVNAWVESRLRNGATNDRGEMSLGLFQINRNANPQYDAVRLRDPAYNTRAILDLLVARAEPVERGLRRGATIAALTAAVTYFAERPKDRAKKAEQRAGIARQWYGSVADRAALGWRA